MKNILRVILAVYARLTLKLHQPKIIGITGSVGKSSAKEAIALVLRAKFSVGMSQGNLNSDIGLPLSVLGFKRAGGFKKNLSSVFGWLWILFSGFFRIFRYNFPEVLVLEMGADRPGDISYLLSIVGHLDIAVVTDIGISHLEFFPNVDALAAEKLSILKDLSNNGWAILNADNEKVLSGKNKTHGQVITYGFNSADLQASNLEVKEINSQQGQSFQASFHGERADFFLPNTVGKPAVYAALAAAAAGISMGQTLAEVSEALKNYRQPAGRLRLIKGINNTIILDDTYNAAPSSTIAAIEALDSVLSQRKLAAIGHMAELGEASEAGHRQVGAKIAENNINLVFLVGEKTRVIEDELRGRKFTGKVFWFANSDQAKLTIKQNLQVGDAILVKGSQSARMEKIVREIMAEPEQAEELLVRQSNEWLKE